MSYLSDRSTDNLLQPNLEVGGKELGKLTALCTVAIIYELAYEKI
jgi:hypothetical protein